VYVCGGVGCCGFWDDWWRILSKEAFAGGGQGWLVKRLLGLEMMHACIGGDKKRRVVVLGLYGWTGKGDVDGWNGKGLMGWKPM